LAKIHVKADEAIQVQVPADIRGETEMKTESICEGAHWRTRYWVTKYKDREAYERGEFYEVYQGEGNLLLNAGINRVWSLVAGSSGVPYDNNAAELGVGDGTAAEAATQTDLQGVNTFFKDMDSGYPTYGTAQKITFQSTYAETEANFDWQEWGVRTKAPDLVMLNRKVDNMGTKASGAVWTLTVEITLS